MFTETKRHGLWCNKRRGHSRRAAALIGDRCGSAAAMCSTLECVLIALQSVSRFWQNEPNRDVSPSLSNDLADRAAGNPVSWTSGFGTATIRRMEKSGRAMTGYVSTMVRIQAALNRGQHRVDGTGPRACPRSAPLSAATSAAMTDHRFKPSRSMTERWPHPLHCR
jgi:hypothetical protein